jgi:hypothetical protein
VPAILSDPLMAVWVDLVIGENAAPSFIRVPDYATPDDRAQYMTWIFQGASFVQASSFSAHERRGNCLSPRRLSSIKRPISNVQSRQGKLSCESGEVTIRRDISVIWELGLRGG